MSIAKIAVLGGGSFGTVIANIAAEGGFEVQQWMRNAQRAQEINQQQCNSRYLPDVTLDKRLQASCDLAAVLAGATLIFVAIPSGSFRQVVRQAAPLITPGAQVVSTTKGIEADSFSLMSEVLDQELKQVDIGVLSGPNLAKELARKQLTATVIASDSQALRRNVQQVLHLPYFRVYASDDRYGVELGGTLKNIYAIAAGLSSALGMGENTKSMLLTRGLAEMSRFAVSQGANPLTFLGLAGVGDLIVTCTSPLSRNYRVGHAIGSGQSLDEATEALGEVAEGINTLKLIRDKALEREVYMPLVQGLYEVVFNGAPIADIAKAMMMSNQSSDVEFVLPREEP